MKLRDTNIRKVKPGPKPRKMYDGDGLYLIINPTGSRLWRMKYRYAGKEKSLSFGKYPHTSLKRARELTFESKNRHPYIEEMK